METAELSTSEVASAHDLKLSSVLGAAVSKHFHTHSEKITVKTNKKLARLVSY